jgi:hypothetical protein
VDAQLRRHTDRERSAQFLLMNIATMKAGTCSWRMNLDALPSLTTKVNKAIEPQGVYDNHLFVRGAKSRGITFRRQMSEPSKRVPSRCIIT